MKPKAQNRASDKADLGDEGLRILARLIARCHVETHGGSEIQDYSDAGQKEADDGRTIAR